MSIDRIITTDLPEPPTAAERYVTMKQVASTIGIPYYHIVRAVRAGLIPHHTLLNGKKYLLMSEVLEAIKKHGGEV